MSFRQSWIAWFAGIVRAVMLATVAVSCRYPLGRDTKPGTAPHCQEGGICVEIVSARLNRPTIGMWVDTPEGTRLRDVRAVRGIVAPCGGGRSVEWVTIDGDVLYLTGPAPVGGSHGLVLGFAEGIWGVNQGETFVDLELIVSGGRRCVRSRLTDAASQLVFGR